MEWSLAKVRVEIKQRLDALARAYGELDTFMAADWALACNTIQAVWNVTPWLQTSGTVLL